MLFFISYIYFILQVCVRMYFISYVTALVSEMLLSIMVEGVTADF